MTMYSSWMPLPPCMSRAMRAMSERLAAIVALDQRDHLRRRAALVHQATDTQRALQAQRDFGLHVGEFLLHQLRLRQRTPELLAVEGVLTPAEPAILRSSHHAPGNARSGRG